MVSGDEATVWPDSYLVSVLDSALGSKELRVTVSV